MSNDINIQEFKNFANQCDDYRYVVIDKTKKNLAMVNIKNGFMKYISHKQVDIEDEQVNVEHEQVDFEQYT